MKLREDQPPFFCSHLYIKNLFKTETGRPYQERGAKRFGCCKHARELPREHRCPKASLWDTPQSNKRLARNIQSRRSKMGALDCVFGPPACSVEPPSVGHAEKAGPHQCHFRATRCHWTIQATAPSQGASTCLNPERQPAAAGRFCGRCALTLPGRFVIQLVWLFTPGLVGRRVPVRVGRSRSEN
jgi:hypothetical protein